MGESIAGFRAKGWRWRDIAEVIPYAETTLRAMYADTLKREATA